MSRPRKFNKEDWGLIRTITPCGMELKLCHKTYLHAYGLIKYEWRKIGLSRYQEIFAGQAIPEQIWNSVAGEKTIINQGPRPGLNVHW